ncbi:MAG: type II toxin-antitoxin system HicA family toxin [Acidobacteria bacterium]|nr:type II toxin-antitoxin system HicA family toxin [Acidobacteriota bacterium]
MSRQLPSVSPKQVLRALQKAGFSVHHVTGSHYVLKPSKNPTLRVTVPYHNRDLKLGTLRSIIRQAGLTFEDFLELL